MFLKPPNPFCVAGNKEGMKEQMDTGNIHMCIDTGHGHAVPSDVY